MEHYKESLEQVVLTRLTRLNAMIYGIVLGVVFGAGIFLATNWLIIKGGPIRPDGEPAVGLHLGLLSQYFIGYEVTFVGSLVGFAYAFVLGFIIGYMVATIYNWLVMLKEAKKKDRV